MRLWQGGLEEVASAEMVTCLVGLDALAVVPRTVGFARVDHLEWRNRDHRGHEQPSQTNPALTHLGCTLPTTQTWSMSGS